MEIGKQLSIANNDAAPINLIIEDNNEENKNNKKKENKEHNKEGNKFNKNEEKYNNNLDQNKKDNKEEPKIQNEKEIIEVISKIKKASKDYSEKLKLFSNTFSNKIEIFLDEINIFKDIIEKDNSNFFFLNEKPCKPSKDRENKIIKNEPKIPSGKYIKLIDKIYNVYSQIFSSIEHNFDIMLKFLDISRHIDKINPVNDFLFKEFNNILNCWLFKKIDFTKFDFNQALDKYKLEENFKEFVSKEFKKKHFNLNIICPKGEIYDSKEQKKAKEKKENDIKLIEESQSELIKLYLANVGDVSSYLGNKIEFINLKKLYIENSIISNPNIFKIMNNLENLTIRSCSNFPIEMLEYLPPKIKKLSLEKNNYVNMDFENILKGIFPNNNNLLENLEYLSFAGNNLTRIDISTLPSKTVFKGLKEINFRKNNIYKFIFNPDKFPKLSFIDGCKNNLNKSYLSHLKKIGSLESENGFLFEPEICKKYFNNIKQKLITNEKCLYKVNYLNISYIPKEQSIQYFNDFNINEQIRTHLKKLDLSNNELNCDIFFKFVEQNKGFINLRSLNLNGNEIDDTFFEKFHYKYFSKLQHLYLNSNKIGDSNVNIAYYDKVKIDEKYKTDKDKKLVYKLRLIYKFIQNNICLNKLTITKNPLCDFYSVVPEPNKNADKSDKYLKKDENNKIIINCLFSLLIKIRDELLKEEEENNSRNSFNLRFDCRSNVNKNSENYPYNDRPIIYKREK